MQLGQGLHIAFDAHADKRDADSDWPLLENLIGMDKRGKLYAPLHPPLPSDQASLEAEAPGTTQPGRIKARKVLVMVPQNSDGKKRASKRALRKKLPSSASSSSAPERAFSAQPGVNLSAP